MGELGDEQPTLINGLGPQGKATTGSEQGQDDGDLGLQTSGYEGHWLQDPTATAGLDLEGPEEEIPPEEVAGDELLEAPSLQVPNAEGPDPEEHLDHELEVAEMSQLSITERTPSASTAKCRRRRNRRLQELAKPKTNWQTLKDRRGCCCKGFVWIAPRKTNLQLCLYWPSVYWTERFLEDTTLTVTVPAVSRRVEELARPKRFYLEYYNNNRTTPVWPIPRSTVEYQATNRLKELATPRIRNNIWSLNMSEVSQVSRAAQSAVPTPRIVQLAQPRPQATLLEEWDPMPKPRSHVSDYGRLLQLATPKTQSEQCVPDRSPRWEVLDVTKKAVASSRIVSLAQPRIRKDFNEGYDPYHISPAALVARASPRLYELATPKTIVKRM